MMPQVHVIAAIKQNTAECMQTAATQLLSFYDPKVKVSDVINEVPIYIENGEKIGTSPGHLAAYFAQRGYDTTVYVFDTELFDRSWVDKPSTEVVDYLKQRQSAIPTNSWLSKYHHILVDGWDLFAQSGGKFAFAPISIELLHTLITEHPFLLMVNSTYLNGSSKQRFDPKSDSFINDSIQGRSLTHAVTCAGYKDNRFLIVDPDPPKNIEQHRWIAADHLIASVMSAQTESDNLLMVIKNPDTTK